MQQKKTGKNAEGATCSHTRLKRMPMYARSTPPLSHIQDCLRKLEYCDEVLYFL